MNTRVYKEIVEYTKTINMKNILSNIMAFIENDSVEILKKDIFVSFAGESNLSQLTFNSCILENKDGNIIISGKKYKVNEVIYFAIGKAAMALIKDEVRAGMKNIISVFDDIDMSKSDRARLHGLTTAIFGNMFYKFLTIEYSDTDIVDNEMLKNQYDEMQKLKDDVILLGILRQCRQYQSEILEHTISN